MRAAACARIAYAASPAPRPAIERRAARRDDAGPGIRLAGIRAGLVRHTG